MLANVAASHLLPRAVVELLQRGSAQAGITAQGFCWVLSQQQLHLWRFDEGSSARLRSLTLLAADRGWQ